MNQPTCPKCGARSGMIWSVADRRWYCLYDSAWVSVLPSQLVVGRGR
jgi:hypothetical protein